MVNKLQIKSWISISAKGNRKNDSWGNIIEGLIVEGILIEKPSNEKEIVKD